MAEIMMDKEFIKKYGDYVTTGEKVLETKRSYKTISISPAIDLGLGGGIKEGSWMILSGPPKAGKTKPQCKLLLIVKLKVVRLFILMLKVVSRK